MTQQELKQRAILLIVESFHWTGKEMIWRIGDGKEAVIKFRDLIKIIKIQKDRIR